jgi:hypothetical protein
MMALAAVPAVLLAGGGAAVAQSASAPAGTTAVQVCTHHGSDRGAHQAGAAMMVTPRHDRDRMCDRTRDHDRAHPACQRGTQADRGMMTRAHHAEGHGRCGDG